jgi:type I restriction enzyme S subunit
MTWWRREFFRDGDAGGGCRNLWRHHKECQALSTSNSEALLSVANVNFNRIDTNNLSNIGVNEAEIAHVQLMPGDLMVVEGNGSLSQLGRVAVWQGQVQGCLHQNHLIKVRPKPIAKSKWLLYWLMSSAGRRAIEATASSTSGLHTLSLAKVGSLPTPIASLEEQEIAIAYIELHLSRLDETVATLQGIQAKLKQARASILKAAVEGRLAGTNLVIKGQSPLQAEIHIADNFPSHWQRSTIGQACDVSGGITKNASKEQGGILMPYLRVANVYANHLDLSEVKSIHVSEHLLKKYLLNKGDLLIVEGNGSIEQLGRVAIWDGSIESCVHQNHLIKARPHSPSSAKYLLDYLNSPHGRRQIKEVSTSTSGLHTLSISKIERIELPLPPENEVREIIAEVDRRFSVLDQVEATVQTTLARCGLLRQAILKRAFRG